MLAFWLTHSAVVKSKETLVLHQTRSIKDDCHVFEFINDLTFFGKELIIAAHMRRPLAESVQKVRNRLILVREWNIPYYERKNLINSLFTVDLELSFVLDKQVTTKCK